MNTKNIVTTILLAFLSLSLGQTNALTPKETKGVITLESPSLAYEQPDRVSPYVDIREAPTDISYWKGVLPWDEYQNEAMYIVLPTLGVVAPVVDVPSGSDDYTDMMEGREIDINKYLNDGVMFYPGTAPVGEVGNPVIFGHSNFFRAGQGNFKTIFADIMNLDVGVEDEMRVYWKKGNSDYEMFRYEITQSYETTPEDVGILQPQGGKELTVFACTNGLAGRWILRGKLIEQDEVLVTFNTRIRVRKLMERMRELDESQQAIIIEKFGAAVIAVSNRLPETLETYEDKYLMYVLRWMKGLVG